MVQFSGRSKILIVGQAPGTKVHKSGIAWDDESGDRLREWLGLAKPDFYDADKIAMMPMGFCYPGKAAGGDAPPRKECAPQWHKRLMAVLPSSRLTLLVGMYAQQHYLPAHRSLTLTARVQRWKEFGDVIPLPHPAWRVRMWMSKNPWFAEELLPDLRGRIAHLTR